MSEIRIVPPKMHWEIGTPQEQILEFVRHMKHSMAMSEGSEDYVSAYQTVENHIVKYMPFWEQSAVPPTTHSDESESPYAEDVGMEGYKPWMK